MQSFEAESLDMDKLCTAIKKQHRLDPKEVTNQIIEDTLCKGVIFKERLLATTFSEFDNPFTDGKSRWYYFICPECKKKAKKIYFIPNKVGCRTCLKLRDKLKVQTDSDRILRIQTYLSEIFNGKNSISPKRKKLLVSHIINHYNDLGDRYKLGHNALIFKELEKWCYNIAGNKDYSPEYRKAISDIRTILETAKQIMLKTKVMSRHHIR